MWAAASRAPLDLPEAVKVGIDASAILRGRFRREAAVLQAVGPRFAPLFRELGQLDDGRPWIAMERLYGRTLAAKLGEEPGPMDPSRALGVADGVLACLEAVHALGVTHRDLKPDNVFLGEAGGREGQVLLLDFGLATAPLHDAVDLTRAGMVMGTPHYMAPEQIQGAEAIDARADLYAFGVILFRLLTGRLPFDGDASAVEYAHVALRPPRLSRSWPVTAPVEEIVLACLAKGPSRRPASAAEVRRALEAARTEGRVPGPTPAAARGEAPPIAILRSGARQTVVLLLADTRAAMPAVVAAITRHKGIVARQRGTRYLAVFTAPDAEHPTNAARAAAQDIVSRLGGRAALEVSSVSIRRGDRGALLVAGADVDRPESWIPAEPWSGVVLGADVTWLLADDEPPSTGSSGRRVDPTLGNVDRQIPLVGRERVLAAMELSATQALDHGWSALFTIAGDSGLGKTRLSLEAAIIALKLRPDARITVLRPGPPARGIAPEIVSLLRAALNAPGARPDDLDALCRERLGDQVGAETWPSVAAALGWGPEALLRRNDLVRAIAEGLRRRGQEEALVVVLDDAHRADSAVLDSLETATLDGEGTRLWVVVAALPRFEELRPQWGTRTQRFDRAALAPLDPAAAETLAAELLLPAEYVPASILERLARWCEGNPRCLTEIVGALKRAGVVRQRPGAEGHYVATAEVVRLTASPAWQWLAVRCLDALPPDLASCAQLCAVIGASFTRAELEWVQEALDREGSPGTPIDAGFGVDALVERSVLRQSSEDRWTFQTRLIRDGIVALVDPEQRRTIHRHALAYWRARVDAAGATREHLEPLAAHASACGVVAEAVDAHLLLGDLAFSRHCDVEADGHYAAAFDGGADARQSTRALVGRGRCRYRMYRASDASKDLATARAAAAKLGDQPLVAEILLEEATALDWAEDFAGSAQRVGDAAKLAARLGASDLEPRLLLGQARTLMRRGEMSEAVVLLERALAHEDAGQDGDTLTVALVLLSLSLVGAGKLGEAEARFKAAIELAAAAEDWLHLAVLHANRAFLWAARKDHLRAVADLSRAVRYARQIGHPFLERQATFNVAELLHWEARLDEALALIRRARILEQRFVERPGPESSVLLARVLLMSDAHEEAAVLVEAVRKEGNLEVLAPPTRAFLQMLERALGELAGPIASASAAGWDEIMAAASGKLMDTELIELLYWRARLAIRGGRWAEARAAVDEADPSLRAFPAWRSRFEALWESAPHEAPLGTPRA